MYGTKTQRLALSGVTIALVIISLYLGTIIKNNRIFFMSFAIIIGVIPYIVGQVKYGITAYLATICLAFILIPNPMYSGIYAIFGIYPLIKLIAEKRNRLISYIIKLIWFNLSVVLGYVVYNNFIYINEFFFSTAGKITVVLVVQIFFLGFDYIFNVCISYFVNRILKGVR